MILPNDPRLELTKFTHEIRIYTCFIIDLIINDIYINLVPILQEGCKKRGNEIEETYRVLKEIEESYRALLYMP